MPSARRSGELTLDELLAVLGNPLRREILSRIAHETHYPLQLSKELGVSQQAVMKHLTVLRRLRLVRCTEKKSTSQGPPRKCYVNTGQFSIRIDVGPSTFETKLIPLDEKASPGPAPPGRVPAPPASEPRERLRSLQERLAGIDREIDELEERRMSLTALKQDLLQEAGEAIFAISDDYLERRLLYFLMENPGAEMEEMESLLRMDRELIRRAWLELHPD